MERKELTVNFTTNGMKRQYKGISNPMSEDIVKKTINVGECPDFMFWKLFALLNHWEKI